MKQTHTINITLTQDEIEALEKAKNILFDIRDYSSSLDSGKLVIQISNGDKLVFSNGEVKEAIELLSYTAIAENIHWEQKEE